MSGAVPVFDVRGLRFTYPHAARPALRDVSLSVNQGEFRALIGPNGSGKSTLTRLLLRTLRPDAGSIRFRAQDIAAWPRRHIAQRVGVVPQGEQHAFPMSAREVVEMGRYPHLGAWRAAGPADRAAVLDAMDRCDVLELAERPVTTLSGGERQRVLIARALAQRPSELMLDEPTASLDVRHEMAIFELLRQLAGEGVTVVLVTHNINLASRYADRLLLLDRGAVAADGRPTDVLRPEIVRAVYGWPVAVRPHGESGPDRDAPQVVPLSGAAPERIS